MSLFEHGTFEGELVELIERCMRFVPEPERLAEVDRWMATLEEDGRLLPVRKFAGHSKRGEVFTVGRRRFIPIDNETLAHIYRDVLRGSAPRGDLEDLYRGGALTVSWKLDTALSLLGPGVRKGQVAAPFRDEGLKLAHLIDAARGLPSETEADLVHRFRLTLNPLNCFPFPSPRRFRFEPVRGYSDPGEMPQVQVLLAAALAEHAGESFHAYRARVGGDREPLPNRWRDLARDIHIRFMPRAASRTVFCSSSSSEFRRGLDRSKVVDSDFDAISPRGEPLRLASLAALVDALREWRRTCPHAERLHGHRTFLKTDRRTGRQTISSSDPKAYVYFRVSPNCPQPTKPEAAREWHLNGDTTVAAVDELICLYETQEEFDDVFQLLDTKTQRKLILQGQEESNGFYCYG